MKIFLTTLMIALMGAGAMWWLNDWLVDVKAVPQIIPDRKQYFNEKYNYSIDWLNGYAIDDTLPELVSFQNEDKNLRVNVGCLAFGLENLQSTSEPVVINGRNAMKEQLYDEYKLRLTRYTFTQNEVCYSLEFWASTNLGREELEELIGSFQIH